MKTRHMLALGSCALCQAISPALCAADVFRLDTDIRIFRSADFGEMQVNSAQTSTTRSEDGKSWTVLKGPLTIARGQHTLLSMDTAGYTWNKQAGADTLFNALSAPAIVLKSGSPVKITVSGNVQYFEKLPNGDYRLHEEQGGPQSAYSDLEFIVQPSTANPSLVRVDFESTFSVVSSREKIPGVDLDVGKPIMASFKNGMEFTAAPGEWNCILGRGPAGNDYGMLILVKVTQVSGPPPVNGKKPADEGTPVVTFRLDSSAFLEIAPTRDDWMAAYARLTPKDQLAIKRLHVRLGQPDSSLESAVYYRFPFGERDSKPEQINRTERLNPAAVIDGFNQAFPCDAPRIWVPIEAQTSDQINELAAAERQRHWFELDWTFRSPKGKTVYLSADDFGPGVIREGAIVGSLVREMDQTFAQVFLELVAQMDDGQ